MSQLPQIKPTELLTFFIKQGFVISRQTGSHARLAHIDGRKITLAIHNRPIALGTLGSVLRQAHMDKIEFIKLFKK